MFLRCAIYTNVGSNKGSRIIGMMTEMDMTSQLNIAEKV